MAEALAARSGRDFAPRRSRGAKASAVALLRPAFALVRRHPLPAAGALLACLAAGSVSWNALAIQARRHPAPLFATKPPPASRPIAQQIPRSSTPVAPAPPQAPPVAKAPRDAAVEITRSTEPSPAIRPQPARIAASRDPIGDVIRSGETAPTAQKPEGGKGVAAAQRALIKLGYGPVKPDGMMGPATRQALERFERDRRLPVTGEVGPKTARELSAQAGIPIE